MARTVLDATQVTVPRVRPAQVAQVVVADNPVMARRQTAVGQVARLPNRMGGLALVAKVAKVAWVARARLSPTTRRTPCRLVVTEDPALPVQLDEGATAVVVALVLYW
jgi:hypothetical protein